LKVTIASPSVVCKKPEVNAMNTSATADTIDLGKQDYSERKHDRDRSCKGGRKWSRVELVTMIGGFILFWPVGLVALGAKFASGEIWPGSKQNIMPWTAYQNWRTARGDKPFGFANSGWAHQPNSGNAAFDAYKKAQLERLEAERRKLEEEQKAFAEHLTKLRQAKDQEEFDRFMAERNSPKTE
jgi:hypothetical protein